jgi:CDP-glucose 4,6-dehydratase
MIPRSFGPIREFYKGRRVALTGHTGFKGSWLAVWLHKLGAKVLGIGLRPSSPISNYSASGLASFVEDRHVDIRDYAALSSTLTAFRPEVVFHLAAQAIVGSAQEDPLATFSTNVMGTAHVLEWARNDGGDARALVMITSDKCYENVEQMWGYREPDRLGGGEPYGASKACAELAIQAFAQSYFRERGPAVAAARAGNVVGGGDWSKFRLVPDCIRALRDGQPIRLRNPKATRPWQFVLDPLAGYLILAAKLAEDRQRFSGAWNFGPPVDNGNTVERGASEIVANWGSGTIASEPAKGFAESTLLQLDCTKARQLLGFAPVLAFEETMRFTTSWYRHQHDTGEGNMLAFTLSQIEEFERLLEAQTTS